MDGAIALKKKYETLQINVRETEAHTGTLLSVLRMATGNVSVEEAKIKDVVDMPALFEVLGLNEPEFFDKWRKRIEEMSEANLQLHECCKKVVLQFGTNADIHAASSSRSGACKSESDPP